ncbi:hypothetical protein C0Q70_04739 [Pomacea canaliculata]|uniref:GDNF/GAS1 domain-containing protein n=1 Tax=Pomacea canaliculata TaxID=400727 RepID=A0A2T7PJ75_POMCA|nr:uncharacterized protein LOC112559908 isoform X2 [Pomacea canaliculata]XP_025087179.1 uncharacterized protein LOC112559908 isoform X2 [Pomacea canaliculata]XP_025087180.1 uncharacterized protein LOC112559908 isoform X2 [Pomacea canaliculata]PVD33483.1 hypothetical protein C0Q70_04739 [Pomacea canaliculata]
MFAAESRITMTMLTAIVVFTCTWLFANADPKPCPQAFDCIKVHDECISEATFTCLRNLRGTCDVDESKVSFSELLPYFEKICNDSFSDFHTCDAVGGCLENITISQIMEAPPDQRNATSGLLVLSDTYCSDLQDFATCVINEKEAGRCTISTEFLNYIMDIKQNLAKLCGSTGSVGGLVVNTVLILIVSAIASFAK